MAQANDSVAKKLRLLVAGIWLLTLALPGCVFSLWMLWGSLFAPAGEQIYGPGAEAYAKQKAREMTTLLRGGDFWRPWRDWPADREVPARVREVDELVRKKYQGFGMIEEPIIEAVVELEKRQAAEVREWRLFQALWGISTLLASAGITWLGLRLMRRAKLAGTVFDTET